MKDKAGFLGTLFASLCCLGVPIAIAPLTAIGLGFLIHDLILIPLVLLFSLITLWGLYEGKRRHKDGRPLLIGALGALVLVPSFFISAYLAAMVLLALLGATTWNTVASVRARQS